MRSSLGAYSTQCERHHRHGALPILLTSRAMYHEAMHIFYMNNRIVIWPNTQSIGCVFAATGQLPFQPYRFSENPPGQPHIPAGRAHRNNVYLANLAWHDATKLFIQHVSLTGPRNIRNLEIVFPMIGLHDSFLYETPAYREWLNAVNYLALVLVHPDAANLNLVIHIRSPHSAFDWPFEDAVRKMDTTQTAGTGSGNPNPGARPPGMPLCNEKLAEMEVNLEKLATGDSYNSYAVGKGKEHPSPWLQDEWKRFISGP
ncbi:hypothetical protein PENSUB_12903 [Penicillium subrubescens]|uniref:Uncharacterized protein n=1 Tax=Penicillium subrubescens TaxID=1316194 RepID=A0A1Q5SVL9_9EURO|nr:hypothetical protein PENSUB_12903 [Penicillium subrubescens]